MYYINFDVDLCVCKIIVVYRCIVMNDDKLIIYLYVDRDVCKLFN